MSWVLIVGNKARARTKKFPLAHVEQINDALHRLEKDPFFGDVIKLKGEDNNYRLRVGSYRIKYELFQSRSVIFVHEIERRSSNTY